MMHGDNIMAEVNGGFIKPPWECGDFEMAASDSEVTEICAITVILPVFQVTKVHKSVGGGMS